jgi:ubiquinone/menaquinone biosynthesis C-methylase UbiE
VVSQFGMMFSDDRPVALRQMMRVLRPGGRLAVAVCDALDHSPGYAVIAELLQRLFGHEVADAFRAPFVMGDRRQLLSTMRRDWNRPGRGHALRRNAALNSAILSASSRKPPE